MDALVAGLYEGAFAASEIAASGTLGLGCGDALDGELLLLDGTMYLCRGGSDSGGASDGGVRLVEPDERLPFAEVVAFEPTFTRRVHALGSRALDALIDQLVPSNNLFYAIRLDGDFDRMSVRDAVRQQKPFRGLAEAVKEQREKVVDSTSGTIVGFKGPDVFQGLSVADFHLHYLDEARQFGGHVLDFQVRSATLSIEAYSTFTLHLPEVESYLGADLDEMDSDQAIRQAEA